MKRHIVNVSPDLESTADTILVELERVAVSSYGAKVAKNPHFTLVVNENFAPNTFSIFDYTMTGDVLFYALAIAWDCTLRRLGVKRKTKL